MKNKNVYLVILAAIVGLAIFFGYSFLSTNKLESQPKVGMLDNSENSLDWKDVELVDVVSGEKFRISDFSGKPVLLESFAVWCPTCLKQQKEIKKLKDAEGDSIIHVSIDTDPNEDASKVQGHVDKNGFDWFFAVTPAEVTQALIDEFGVEVINAPSAPVVLICENQEARFLNLKRGIKSASILKAEVDKGCP